MARELPRERLVLIIRHGDRKFSALHRSVYLVPYASVRYQILWYNVYIHAICTMY